MIDEDEYVRRKLARGEPGRPPLFIETAPPAPSATRAGLGDGGARRLFGGGDPPGGPVSAWLIWGDERERDVMGEEPSSLPPMAFAANRGGRARRTLPGEVPELLLPPPPPPLDLVGPASRADDDAEPFDSILACDSSWAPFPGD